MDQSVQSEREAVLHKAKQYLSATVGHIREGLVASPLAELNLAITWLVTIDQDIAAGIIRVAKTRKRQGVFGGADLIAMATHGSSGLQRWTLGQYHRTGSACDQAPPPDCAAASHAR